ncbi:MaoC family dehydratase [Azospirillum sp. TSO22-1]|uniref:MaoC family dehydratase n=1 Tax=Azospirillum sp. TSO22-1 TaxID=716789 RepID=UPI000D60994B|nr:MaoC family dehydratase [Azospirillum sp. TSO22-1]PWC42353.1 dehydratase [Azospirillum sp. TSO22-1]
MLYLDDLKPGDRHTGTSVTVSEEDIFAFARQFDPQPFHLDPEAAKGTVFRGLAASGWHTAALTMRMIVDGPHTFAGGFIGMGVESLAWPRPVRAGDTLTAESEVLEVRPSTKRPDQGVVRVRVVTRNQNGEDVLHWTANLLVQRRSPADASAEVDRRAAAE